MLLNLVKDPKPSDWFDDSVKEYASFILTIYQ